MSAFHEYDSDSDSDSLESIAPYETRNAPEDPEQDAKLLSVRDAVRSWKQREMDKNTNSSASAKSLGPLRSFVANSAQLFYDLQSYLDTSQNKESNLKDKLYVAIVSAIGNPAALPLHSKILMTNFLERDLVELPFTIEPTVINSYAEKGLHTTTEFPEEE
jgi:hypothetical protein